MYGSTCFWRPHAHHQELNNCRPDHDQQHCYHHAPTVKPETATAVVEFMMMGVRTPETCWAVHKRQVINLKNCCIWLVDLFELPYLTFSESRGEDVGLLAEYKDAFSNLRRLIFSLTRFWWRWSQNGNTSWSEDNDENDYDDLLQ